MATVTFEQAQRWYPGADKPAVPGLDLEIGDGEFMVLVGPSGCGKSTSLRMLAGLEEINEGKIYIGDRDVTHTPPKDRDIAMVFQNYALYPHMSVADNMAFALKMAKVPDAERKKRVVSWKLTVAIVSYFPAPSVRPEMIRRASTTYSTSIGSTTIATRRSGRRTPTGSWPPRRT